MVLLNQNTGFFSPLEVLDAQDKYTNCLQDIKDRLEVIATIINQKITEGIYEWEVECVALMFRKIFEAIALSSLITHKNYYSEVHKRFMNETKIEDILKKVCKINPEFYPKPVKLNVVNGVAKKEAINEGFMTENELIAAWKIASDILHTANPYGKPKDYQMYTSIFFEWNNKIITLLSSHTVMLPNGIMLLGIMKNSAGKAKATFYKSINSL